MPILDTRDTHTHGDSEVIVVVNTPKEGKCKYLCQLDVSIKQEIIVVVVMVLVVVVLVNVWQWDV